MISRLVLAALAACALTGAAPAQDTQQSPLSTDISAQRAGGFRGGGFSAGGFRGGGFSGGGFRGGLAGAGFRGGGPGPGFRGGIPGGGMRAFSGGGFRSFSGVPGGGVRFAGTGLRGVAPVARFGPRFAAASFAAPGLRPAFRSGVWHDPRHRHFRRAAFIGGLGAIWWGSRSWYPYSYAAGPYCSGFDADGCLLRWADVPVGGGYFEPRCVSYCPF